MKVLILVFCLLATNVYADDFLWTGFTAEKVDPIGWIGGGGGPLGGPVGNNLLGLAQQFEIFAPTHMIYLNVNAMVMPLRTGDLNFRYGLYSDSTNFYQGEERLLPIPSVESLIMQSEMLSYSVSEHDTNVGDPMEYYDQIAFDYIFQPGKYWLSEEGTGGSPTYLKTTYVDPPIVDTATVPEPSTWMLFAVIILFLLVKQKKFAL